MLHHDIRYALRTLRRQPGFAAVAIASLALGIGVNTAIFTLIDAILLKSLPVADPQRLVVLRQAIGKSSNDAFSFKEYQLLRAAEQPFTGLMAYSPVRLNAVIDGEADPYGAGQLVSGNYFSVLGVNAAIGRVITPDDDRIQGAHPVVVISHSLWKRRFALDPSVLRKSVLLAGMRFTVIGVTPPEFFGTDVGSAPDFFVPLVMQAQVMPGRADWIREDKQSADWLHLVGRLKPGVTQSQALAGLQAPYEKILEASRAYAIAKFGSAQNWDRPRLELISGERGISELRRRFSRPLVVLMGAVALVLLIACANVANLLLARAAARQKEIAVRLAIGAGRRRLVRQLLTESVLLALAGGLAGLVFASWSVELLLALLPRGPMPLGLHASPDARMLGFTAAISLVTGLVFGLAPALRATRLDLSPTLKDSAQAASSRGWRFGLGKLLVVSQIALSLVLLIGAALLVRTLANLKNVDLGFARENLLSLRVEPMGSEFKSPALDLQYQELLRRVRALPGVRAASLAGYGPVSRNAWERGQSYEGAVRIVVPDNPATANGVPVHTMQIYPSYFETMGISLVAGRDIAAQDTQRAQQAAVINESMARACFGGGNPVGRQFGPLVRRGASGIEVVGVVKDAKYGNLRQPAGPMFYMSFMQSGTGRGQMTLHVRSAASPGAVASAVRREVQQIAGGAPMFELQTLDEQVDTALAQERLIARLAGLFGALALVLAAVGLYGVMSYAVARRTGEIGIRMALGAQRGGVIRLVLGDALMLVLAGMAFGLPVAFGAAKLMGTLLFGLSPADPAALAFAALTLLVVAALAGYLPARRAARIDPIQALRWE